MRIVLFGATGYAGGRILSEALARGHEVVGVARDVSRLAPHPRLTARAGSLHDPDLLREVTRDADAVVIATPGRPLEGGEKLLDAVPGLLAAARADGFRLGVVGGAASLLVAEGGPRLLDTPGFPAEFAVEATAHAKVLDALRAAPEEVDWFYLSPPAEFGAHVPGERTGRYRAGGDVLLSDADGRSTIGGDDYALAFVDELEARRHHRARFTVAY
ncbi:NAD(P)-dependent oxidoreductase [Saccharopolyspora sp. MS10]|uniref:NAD(P)-dependent oxidoreductase n=1 Tax=Saccharopolyspora sp. MS10 TaxID=3385973 RepID=UPI00399FFEC5